MPFEEDPDIYPVLIALLTTTQDELAARSNPVTYASVQTGTEPTIDHAGNPKGDCGELIVSYVLGYPIGLNFEPQTEPGCSFLMAHDVLISTFRCAPTVKSGRAGPIPPTAAEYLNSTREVMADMRAMRLAICKALKGRDFLIRDYQPLGETGNAIGGTWTVSVGPPR